MDFIQSERESGINYCADLAATAAAIYKRACEHDGLDPASKFAVFSETNPFVVFYEKALSQYREAVGQYRSLGYVGMTMGGRRAELYKRPSKRKAKAS